ncbi:MAG: nucleotidyltransferase domain-containing protein [Candidatus Thiodiazotropha sp.]
MSEEPTLDQLRESVEKWANEIDSISAIFLFGSRTRNEPDPIDWDICVLVDGNENESWYTIWHHEYETWKKEFCLATRLPEGDKTQFCTVTSHEILSGLFASNFLLYQSKNDIACVILDLSSWLLEQ